MDVYELTRLDGEMLKATTGVPHYAPPYRYPPLTALLVCRLRFGGWIELGLYQQHGNYWNFLHPQLGRALFFGDRGLFIWSPVPLSALAGFPWLWRRNRRLAVLLRYGWAAQVLLVSCWCEPTGHMGFGARLSTGSTPPYVLSLAALLGRLQCRWSP